MKKTVVNDNLALVQNTLEQWLSFKKYLLKSFSEEAEIDSDDESNFLEVKSSVARNIRSLSERLKEVAPLDYGEKHIRELLNKCVSVSHIRSLPAPDKRALFKEWHGAFISLSRCVGALKFMSEGYIPPPPSKDGKGGKGKSRKSKSGGGGNKMPMIIGIVVVLLVGGGIVGAKVLGLF